jgi:proprotein convertase subtilisin/kexin type 5
MTRLIRTVVLLLLLGTVLSCPPNCNDCDPSGQICFACSQGYELSVTGECILDTTVSRCTLYGPSKQCFACQPTYSLDNSGSCLKNGKACLATDPADDTVCVNCGFGTVLSKGQCLGSINCANTENPCSACASGFFRANGSCTDISGNCGTLGSNGICVSCNPGFVLNGYRCVADNVTIYACYIWNSKSECLVCKQGYNLYQNYCLLPADIQSIIKGTSDLKTIIAKQQLNITTTTTTTTTTTVSPNSGNSGNNGNSGFGGFGSDPFGGFGGGSTGFGGFGGGSIPSSSNNSTPSTPNTTGTNNNGGFGGFGSDPFGGFGTPAATLPNCQVVDSFNSSRCTTCNYGYYLKSGACEQASPFCDGYDLLSGACFACKYSLRLNSGKCEDPNCLTPGTNKCNQCKGNFSLNSSGVCEYNDSNCVSKQSTRCSQCASTHFITLDGMCRLLPANCAAANMQTYDCVSCAPGFTLQGTQCVQAQSQIPLPSNCQTASPSDPSLCQVCRAGFTNTNGLCQQAVAPSTPNCQSYNLLTGICIECLSGYRLNGTGCQPIPTTPSLPPTPNTTTVSPSSPPDGSQRDPNCVRYDKNVCAACSNRYYFSGSKCIPVNPLCQNYTSTGLCSSCYPGYQVSGGNCVLAGQKDDPFCRSFNNNSVCTACYSGYFYSQGLAQCKAFNPLCKTSNIVDGTCTSCYPGYTLGNGDCRVAFQDPNCQKFDEAKANCLQCSARFFLQAGKCQQVNPLCKTNDNNGQCLSCYPGYVLNTGNCTVGASSNSDVNCAKIVNGSCQQCSQGYYLSNSRNCVQSNPLCKTSSSLSGACLSCYSGYTLVTGECVVGNSLSGNGDPNCKTTAPSGQCTACYDSFYLSPQATCLRLDPLCKTYSADQRQCASCYNGYSLYQGQCLVASQVPSTNSDPYCIATQGVYCITCANGYFLSGNGSCQQLNPLCKKSDMSTGYCTDCYSGYALSASTCIVAATVSIPYCNKVAGNACVECIQGYFVKAGKCELMSVLCASYDMNSGVCFSCVNGYVFQQGECIYPSMGIDPFCTFYENSFCTQCRSNYALVSYVCTAVDPNCLEFDSLTNTCRKCSTGKIPQGPSCV